MLSGKEIVIMGKKLNEAARELGRKGGRQRAKNLTAEQRRAIGRKGAEARWAERRGQK
jgi:general stress protein YciG